jgi:S1-C subfamily serine protease
MIDTSIDGVPLMARNSSPSIGEEVYTLGYPQGRKVIAYSSGTIVESGDCCLVHDALLAGGSSGGPLLDSNHQVLGLNTLISKLPRDMVNASDRAIAVKIDFIEKKIQEEEYYAQHR